MRKTCGNDVLLVSGQLSLEIDLYLAAVLGLCELFIDFYSSTVLDE